MKKNVDERYRSYYYDEYIEAVENLNSHHPAYWLEDDFICWADCYGATYKIKLCGDIITTVIDTGGLGELKEKSIFERDETHGVSIVYYDAEISHITWYRHGKKEGMRQTFYEGKKISEVSFQNDERHGPHVRWRTDGRVHFVATYQHGKKIEKVYYS